MTLQQKLIVYLIIIIRLYLKSGDIENEKLSIGCPSEKIFWINP